MWLLGDKFPPLPLGCKAPVTSRSPRKRAVVRAQASWSLVLR